MMSYTMYFSGKDSSDISTDEPKKNRIKIDKELFQEVQNDDEKNVRVFLDTPLQRLRNYKGGRPLIESYNFEEGACLSVGTLPNGQCLTYITKLLMSAEFIALSSSEFQKRYLAPLDEALKGINVTSPPLASAYSYPLCDPTNLENDVQQYFERRIAGPLNDLYQDIYGRLCFFGKEPCLRPPLFKDNLIQPSIVLSMMNSTYRRYQSPELCLAIGAYKDKDYFLEPGFERFMDSHKEYKEQVRNKSRKELKEPAYIFRSGTWTPCMLFGWVLRRYLYEALICGTDRVFISDHQTFSGFFQYEFISDIQMVINFYVINDPETVGHGITLKYAMAGFFHKDLSEACETKANLARYLKVGKTTRGVDLFSNVGPAVGRKCSTEIMPPEENSVPGEIVQHIYSKTHCRILYNPKGCYPHAKLNLPTKVFVKLYHYDVSVWEAHHITDLFLHLTWNDYYDACYDEIKVYKKISDSKYACNFPILYKAALSNGRDDHIILVFEYLGEELPVDRWEMEKVYKVIKSRLEELHSLGITHNHVKLDHIHVSVSGRITLVGLGCSGFEADDEHKSRDFESLDNIFQMGKYKSIFRHYDDSDDDDYVDVKMEVAGF